MKRSILSKILLTIMMMFSSVVAFAQAQDAPASADTDRAVSAACRDFTAEQMKDPNSPCYEDIRAEVDPRKSEGAYFEPNVAATASMDESGGGHVLTNIDVTTNTNENIYQVPFLKNAVRRGPPASDTGTDESGTD